MRENEELSKKFRKFFQLPTSPVAIKILDKEIEAPRPKAPSLFCDFVRRAANSGELNVITENDLSNFTARVILGFTEPKYVDIYPRVKPAKTKSVLVGPLEKVDQDPDVVVTITDPERMMRILQVLHRATRKRLEASMTCEASAIAGEATAIPYMEKRPNLTLLCGGARDLAGYKHDELAMGIPFDQFVKLVEQLEEPTLITALCGCRMDEIPKHVEDAFAKIGFDKGTDHFYGDFGGRVFRLYLNKDEHGLLTTATIHYPMKFSSEDEARKSVAKAKALLTGLGGESLAVARETWLDLVLTVGIPDGLEKLALDEEKFRKSLTEILNAFIKILTEIV
ncbi:MAG: DUF169 domain-containing protein [Anaerolineales bacterium]